MIKFWGCIVSAELLAGLQKNIMLSVETPPFEARGDATAGHFWCLMVHFVNHKMTHTQMYQTQELMGLKKITSWAAPNDF